jgi:hypothetical protein
MYMKLKQLLSRREVLVMFVGLFAIVGIAMLIRSRAATSVISSEAESGTTVLPAQPVSDTTASGNISIQFNAPAGGGGGGGTGGGGGVDTSSAILFGSNRPDEADAKFTEAEGQLGRKLDVVRLFRSSWSTGITKELLYANQGKIVHTSFKVWSNWKQVSADLRTAGSTRRVEVENLATSLQNQMPGPFIITIHHEPENDLNAAGGYAEQDFADMFCAFYYVFKSKGATKAKFAPVAIPDFYHSDKSTGAKMYPGDQCSDFNGVDPYNFFTQEKTQNWRTLDQVMKHKNADGSQRTATGWYQWATRDFTGVACSVLNNPTCYGNVKKLDGTTEPKVAKGTKPIVLGEWGSVEYYPCVSPECNTPHAGDPAKKAAWIRQALTDIKAMPKIKVVQYWGTVSVSGGETNFHCFGNDSRFNTTLDLNMTCSTVLANVPTSWTGPSFLAFKDISDDPYVYMTSGLADGTSSSAAAQKRFNYLNALVP